MELSLLLFNIRKLTTYELYALRQCYIQIFQVGKECVVSNDSDTII